MPRPRSTVSLTALTARANHMLAAHDGTADGRVGIIVLLESTLHDANAYRGYRYVDGAQGDDDDTRRWYYVPGPT